MMNFDLAIPYIKKNMGKIYIYFRIDRPRVERKLFKNIGHY